MTELRDELAKWRARVPRLAAALKSRTDEVAALKAALEERGGEPSGTPSSALAARERLIAELEEKVADLGGRHQEAEGRARARDVQVASLTQEVADWRRKWQEATAALDEHARSADDRNGERSRLVAEAAELTRQKNRHAARVKELDLELTALRERTRSLESRNEKLFETIELANRQIETLGGNLELLRAQVRSRKQDVKSRDEQIAAQAREIEALNERLTMGADRSSAELTSLRTRLGASEREVATLGERLKAFRELDQALKVAAGQAGLESVAELDSPLVMFERLQDGQRHEVRRLEDCVARADQTVSQWEVERRELSARLEELTQRNEHLTAQLDERSELVRGLELEKGKVRNRSSGLETENAELRSELEDAQRALRDNATHIGQLNDRLDRQKQLMDDLEQEFAEVQEEYADALKAHQHELAEQSRNQRPAPADAAPSTELAQLRKALSAAETRVAEERMRAESLARALDDRELAASQGEAGRSEAQLKAEIQKLEALVRERTEQLNERRWQQDMFDRSDREGSDSKMLVVLNQQLASAREDNQRLLASIRELETQLAASVVPDDLTRIRGIGPKLVSQLAELDITSFEQIAALKESDLDREDHPLHAIKGRILKDDWMAQAARLAH